MDNNIHINPKSIGKFKAISDVPVPEGYESPITGYINQLSQQIIEQRDNEVVAQINEQIGVNVDKTELIRALNYDRNQFNEGYRKGYRDALEKYEEADRWIPVSERLPEYSGLYLISVDDLVTVANFTGTNFMHRGGGRVEVYAWKPLPKPYIEPLPDYADEYIREKLGESEEEE